MARVSIRSVQSIRSAGAPLNFDSVQTTKTVSGVSSITINAQTPDALAQISQDTFNQIQKQNAIAVITARGRNSITISFFKRSPSTSLTAYLSGGVLKQSSSLGLNGNQQVNTSTLTSTTVNLTNTTFSTSTKKLLGL